MGTLIECLDCKGRGFVYHIGNYGVEHECTECLGKGEVEACDVCEKPSAICECCAMCGKRDAVCVCIVPALDDSGDCAGVF